MFRRAAEYGEIAFAEAPQVLANGRLLAISQNNIASIERQLGREKEALAAYGRAVAVWRKMARDNPAVPYLHSSLFGFYRMLAHYQRELKQTEQAERTLRLAREVIERLPSDSPNDLYNLACFRALCSTGRAQEKNKPTAEELAGQKRDLDLAMEALHKAIDAGYRDLNRLRNDTDLNALRGREDFQALEADLAARVAAAPAEKLKANQQALAHRQKAAQADPKNKRLQADLAASQHAIALIQIELGNVEAARKHLQQAITLREALVKEEPKNAQFQTDLVRSRFALGHFYWKAGRLKEGANSWRQAMERLKTDNQNTHWKPQLAAMHRRIANAYAERCLWEESAAELERAFALQPDYQEYWEIWFGRAELALQLGKPDHFQRICQAFVKRPSSNEHPIKHSECLARLNMLAPGAYPDPAVAVKGALRAFKFLSKQWALFVLGAAHYRAGHYPEAERLIRESMDPELNPRHLFHRWFWLALVCQRQGKAEEAKQWLNKGVQWMERNELEKPPEGGPEIALLWWQALELRLLRREAETLVLGKPTPEPMDLVLKRARDYVRLDQPKKAETAFQAAVASRPNDPAVWLARRRAFAELGWRERADADFAKAAALTPDELDRFPQAGWWVVGPYPENLKLPCPPEKDPDPSRPVAALGSAAELHWRPAPTEPDGKVDLRAIFNAEHNSAYALTYVYSPEERTATLMVGGDDRVRVWLNGSLVHETNRANGWAWGLDRVRVTLKSGRNTLLCKISQDIVSHYLFLRIADNPLDRAILHAQLGLWDEAATLFACGLDRQPTASDGPYSWCAAAHLLLGDTAAYRRYVAGMLQRNKAISLALAEAGGLLDGAVKPMRLVEVAEPLVKNKGSWDFHAAGIAHYRAGQFENAIELLEESLKDPRWQRGPGHASELGVALSHYRLGHAKEARQWLDKAEQWYEKAIENALASPTCTATLYNWSQRLIFWSQWPFFVVLRREAHKVILGKDLPDDPRLKKLADRTRDWLKKRDKATADYDVATFLEPNEPRLLLARARRFIELKRNKDAEADLVKAVQLKPDDPQVWKARGRIYFALGQKDKAAADFAKALKWLPENAETLRREIYADLDRQDQLLDKVAALRPDDAKLAAFRRAREANARDSGPAGIVVAGNLLKNGSFENGPELRGEKTRGYRIYETGSTEVPGWTVFRGSVDVSGLPSQVASHGRRCLDLNGNEPGGIRQTVPTKAGQKYRLVFDLAGNFYAGPVVKKLRVQSAGQSADFTFDVTGRSAVSVGWVRKQWQFTASASRTTLEFLSLDKKGNCGPLLDNIALVPVREERKK